MAKKYKKKYNQLKSKLFQMTNGFDFSVSSFCNLCLKNEVIFDIMTEINHIFGGAQMYPFSVGVMISNYRLPFKEAVEKASRLKLDGIQLAGTREGHDFYPGVMTKDKIAELKNYLKEKNLKVRLHILVE